MLVNIRVFLLMPLLMLIQPSWAEPITPLPGPAMLSRMRGQLWRTAAGPARLHLLVQLGAGLLARRRELDTPLDSADVYARQALALSTRLADQVSQVQSLYLVGQQSCWKEATDTASRAWLRQGLQLSRRLANPGLEALGLHYLTDSYPNTPALLPRKQAAYAQGARLFAQANQPVEQAYMLKNEADMRLLQGYPSQAEQALLRVLALYRAAGHRELHYTYDLLRSATTQVGNYKDALRYGLLALEIAQATRDTASIVYFYGCVAGLYKELRQPAQALAYYRQALRRAQRGHLGYFIVHTSGDISRVLLSQHRPRQALQLLQTTAAGSQGDDPAAYALYLAECYAALGQPATAERYLRWVLSKVNQPATSAIERMHIYTAAGRVYLVAGRPAEAQAYFQRALRLARASGLLVRAADLHQLLFRADSMQGRFPAAIAHYQLYKRLTDSVFNETKNKQLASLEIQYDTRKKEQSIALLTKTNQVQQASLRQREFQRNAVVVGALLLAGLLLLGYNRYRLKQRNNQLLEAQQVEINQQNQSLAQLLADKGLLLAEKEWMLKEIHHRVKNNLEVISSLLNLQSSFLQDPVVEGVLRESQNRVHAIALLHQKLYQSDSLARVNMPTYIRDIVEHLVHSFDREDSIQLHITVEAIELDVTIATPLGLLLNEAVTNSLKYAFPHQQAGIIAVSLACTGPQRYQFTIADNGVGMAEGFYVEHVRTLGITMIKGLSQQLDAALAIAQDSGVQITLQFEATTK